MTDRKTPDLGNDRILKLVASFGIPAVVGLMINASYNFVDRIFIGNGVGALGLAGISVSFPCFVLQMAIGMLIGVGGSVNFAVSLGQRKVPKAEHVLANSFVLVFGLTALFVAVHYAFLEPLLRLYGTTDEIMPYAKSYLSITLAGSVFFTASVTMNNFIRACGFPKIAMITMLIGAVTNTVLDWVFIFKCGWGIAGGAAATVVGQILSFVWAGSFFFSKKCPYRLRGRYLKPNVKIAAIVCMVGMAPFFIQVCNGFVQTVFNTTLVKYGGALAVSAMGIAMATNMLLFMPAIGICEGAQPIIGFNLGARNYKRVLKTYRLLLEITTFIFLFAWVVLQLGAQHVIKLFDPNDAELIRVGSKALKTVILALPFVGFPMTTTYFLQATKCPKMAAFLSLCRQMLFLAPFIVILPRYFGVAGVFFALPCSDFIAFLISIPIYRSQVRKYKTAAESAEV